MIVKNKKIRVINLLMGSSFLTLPLISVSAAPEESAQVSKTEINLNNITASSFEFQGREGSAQILFKNGLDIPEEIEIHSVRIRFQSEETWSSGKKFNIRNNDNVQIRIAIKSYYRNTHIFSGNKINKVFLVSNAKVKSHVEISTTNLNESSFKALKTGESEGTLAIIRENIIPSQVQVKYAKEKRNGEEPSPEDYSNSVPTSLSIGDNVYIQFAVKSGSTSTHKLPDAFDDTIVFAVSEFEKAEVATTHLIADSFEVSGIQGLGTLTQKTKINIPSQVQIKYAKEKRNGEEPSPEDYSNSAPTLLSNDNRVYIKFEITGEAASTHKFPLDFQNLVVFTVSGLKIGIDTTNLVSYSFETNGNNGSKNLSIKSAVSLPSQVEVKYATSSLLHADPNSLSFSPTMPASLSNGDNVYIKFAIKGEAISTHKFPSGFSEIIIFTVDQKTEINTSNLVSSSFETNGHNGSGTLAIKSGFSLPPQVVGPTYATSHSSLVENPSLLSYSSTMPESLSNGNRVYIKFAIKGEAVSTHKFPHAFKNPVVFTVSGLKTRIDTTNLVSSSFETNGHNGSGTLAIKNEVSLPQQVEATYATSHSSLVDENPSLLSYSSTMPESLSNDDKVYIKFAVKKDSTSTHKLPDSFDDTIVFTVKGLLKKDIEVSTLKASSFKVSGSNGSGSLSINADLPPQVSVIYATSPLSVPVPESLSYSSTMPASLSNGDYVYIMFVIRGADYSTHKLPDSFTNNLVFFKVSGLKTEVKTTDLVVDSFETTGTHGSGTITIKTSAKIPQQLKITYAKESENKAPSSGDYSETAPRTLSNDDKVYIKFAIKEDHQETHQFPSDFSNPIILTTTGLNEIESPKESSESEISETETKTSSNKVKKQPKKTKLSKGAIAGIVVGSILGVGAIGGFVAVKFLKIDIKKLMQKMKPKNKK